MPDCVTYAIIAEMEPIYEGVGRRARAELGAWSSKTWAGELG